MRGGRRVEVGARGGGRREKEGATKKKVEMSRVAFWNLREGGCCGIRCVCRAHLPPPRSLLNLTLCVQGVRVWFEGLGSGSRTRGYV